MGIRMFLSCFGPVPKPVFSCPFGWKPNSSLVSTDLTTAYGDPFGIVVFLDSSPSSSPASFFLFALFSLSLSPLLRSLKAAELTIEVELTIVLP